MTPGKRVFDLALAVPGLVVLLPLFALIGAAIKLDDGGPMFFRQTRVGRGEKPFRIWKFRTMVQNAETRGAALTVGRDPRITRVGHHLRRFKLDELPQLFNVLAGEMSLVGPRPEVPRYVSLYTVEQRRVLELVPGITDPASLQYRDESTILAGTTDPESAYINDILPRKLDLALEYARTARLRDDLRVLAQTVFGPVLGASHDNEETRS